MLKFTRVFITILLKFSYVFLVYTPPVSCSHANQIVNVQVTGKSIHCKDSFFTEKPGEVRPILQGSSYEYRYVRNHELSVVLPWQCQSKGEKQCILVKLTYLGYYSDIKLPPSCTLIKETAMRCIHPMKHFSSLQNVSGPSRRINSTRRKSYDIWFVL